MAIFFEVPKLKSLQYALSFTNTVSGEALVGIKTSSVIVGTPSPPNPSGVTDQWYESLQFPLPLTQ